jgi:hypothetical protein
LVKKVEPLDNIPIGDMIGIRDIVFRFLSHRHGHKSDSRSYADLMNSTLHTSPSMLESMANGPAKDSSQMQNSTEIGPAPKSHEMKFHWPSVSKIHMHLFGQHYSQHLAKVKYFTGAERCPRPSINAPLSFFSHGIRYLSKNEQRSRGGRPSGLPCLLFWNTLATSVDYYSILSRHDYHVRFPSTAPFTAAVRAVSTQT